MRLCILYFFLLVSTASATPLTEQEKIDFIKSSVPSCVSKNVVAQKITSSDDKKLIQKYCVCQATTMTAISTREEMLELNSGKVPKSFADNVIKARDECVRNM